MQQLSQAGISRPLWPCCITRCRDHIFGIGKGEGFGYKTFAASILNLGEALHDSSDVFSPRGQAPKLGPCSPWSALPA